MGEHHATVLVAMPPSDRRDDVVAALEDRDRTVVTADDGLDAVDGVRRADAVLVGEFPDPIAGAVVDATTPPGVARPNVLLAADAPEGAEPDERLDPSVDDETVLDAVERAVERATYTERVSEFSAAAAEAATTDRGSPALAERVADLAGDARAVQSEFSQTDWLAAFRSVAPPGNRTS